MLGTCETCGAENEELLVYALPGVPVTVGNCKTCMELNVYPWWIIVANTATMDDFDSDAAEWWKEAVARSLDRLGKSREEFDVAVANVRKEFKEAMGEQQQGVDGNGDGPGSHPPHGLGRRIDPSEHA